MRDHTETRGLIRIKPYTVKTFVITMALLTLSACSTAPYKAPEIAATPAAWHSDPGPDSSITADGLTAVADSRLNELITEALENNHDLAARRAEVTVARQQLVISGAPRIPELSASLSGGQRKLQGTPSSTATTIELSLDLDWELDIWGKLKDTQKQAALTLAAREAELAGARLDLIAAVSNAWYDILEAQRLLKLYEDRLHNLSSNLEIIETGYRQGLNPALDVYLTRNGVEQEAARTTAQQQTVAEAVRRLQLLLGRYPDGQPLPPQMLPQLRASIPAGLPSELISRRPDLRRRWLELMAADIGIAIAHKQRFPRLSITGSVGQSSSELHNLLDASQGIWTLAGGLLQPLINAGKLAAREEETRARLKQLEQYYLSSVFQAFAEVENRLAQEQALAEQYRQYQAAEKNALEAETLSFTQYQRGLVNYATVLESQRRAFDAQSAVLSLQRQRLHNRVALYIALGGDYKGETP